MEKKAPASAAKDFKKTELQMETWRGKSFKFKVAFVSQAAMGMSELPGDIYSVWLCQITSKIATTFTFGVGVTDIVLALAGTLAVVVMIASPKQERNLKTKRQATALTDILLLPCLKMHIPEKD